MNDLTCVSIMNPYSRHHIGLRCSGHEPVVVGERTYRSGNIAAVAGEIYAGGADTDGNEGVVNIGQEVRAG